MDEVSCLEVDDWQPLNNLIGVVRSAAFIPKVLEVSAGQDTTPGGLATRQQPQPLAACSRGHLEGCLQPVTLLESGAVACTRPELSGQPHFAQDSGSLQSSLKENRLLGRKRAATQLAALGKLPDPRIVTTIPAPEKQNIQAEVLCSLMRPVPREAEAIKKQRIPGPAGAVLDAQHQGLHLPRLGGVSTMEGRSCDAFKSDVLLDPDFASRAWAQGLATLGLQTFDEASSKYTIRSALQAESASKVDQLLAVVARLEACSPSGDAFATLKDPTGCVGAGIHSSALAKSPELTVGAVMLLHSVTALRITPTSCYLCVTAQNIRKVIAPQDRTERPVSLLTLPRLASAATEAASNAEWQDDILQSPAVSQTLKVSSQERDRQLQHPGRDADSMQAAAHRYGTQHVQLLSTAPPPEQHTLQKCSSPAIRQARHALQRGQDSQQDSEYEDVIGSVFYPVLGKNSTVRTCQDERAPSIRHHELEELMDGLEDDDDVDDDFAKRTGLWTP